MSSLLEAPTTSGDIALGTRKTLRQHRTTEIRIRSTHRRRKVLTRGGVLAGFVLAMVVYPVFGTLTTYADAAEALPGVVKGESPTTAAALLGGGPQLLSSDLPVPSDQEVQSYLVSDIDEAAMIVADCGDAPILGSNGQLHSESLCPLWRGDQSLANEPATALIEMNAAFRMEFGRNMCLAGEYRTLQEQYATKATRGYLAATPGTSLHGWGIAIDFCSSNLSGAQGEWVRSNSEQYGWGNPAWAKGSKFEPWHYEYIPIAKDYYTQGWGNL